MTDSRPDVRIALVSDVHGNLPALDAAVRDARSHAPDLIAHVGDMVNGPASAGVMDRIVAEGWRGVFGNHEDYVLRSGSAAAPEAWRTDRFAPARWTRKSLEPRHLAEIRAWPITHRLHPDVTLVHGTKSSFRTALRAEFSDAEVRSLYRDIEARVIVCGHTHLPHIRRIGERLYVNIGSTGRVVDGDPRACYALLTARKGSWSAQICRVAYDARPLLAVARRDGWLAEGGGVAATMVHDMLTGTNWTSPFIAWRNAVCPDLGLADAYRQFARMRGIEPLI